MGLLFCSSGIASFHVPQELSLFMFPSAAVSNCVHSQVPIGHTHCSPLISASGLVSYLLRQSTLTLESLVFLLHTNILRRHHYPYFFLSGEGYDLSSEPPAHSSNLADGNSNSSWLDWSPFPETSHFSWFSLAFWEHPILTTLTLLLPFS